MSENNVFERVRRPFRLLGKEFYFEFIPSIHFQSVMQHVLKIMLDLDLLGGVGTLQPVGDYSGVMDKVRVLLEENVYQILFDVLLYQNEHRTEMESLKYRTSPGEVADFLNLLLTDDEIIRAVGVVSDGLGKLVEKLTNLSQTGKSTPSV